MAYGVLRYSPSRWGRHGGRHVQQLFKLQSGKTVRKQSEKSAAAWFSLLCISQGSPEPCFSTLLTLRPCDTAPQVVGTPTVNLFSLLLHNFNFATVMHHNVNICVF